MNIQPVIPLGVDRLVGQRPERIRVQFGTRMRLRDGREIAAEVRNISRRGFMADSDEEIAPGTDLLLHVPGIGWVLAGVRWNRGLRIGCKFPDAIILARLWKTGGVRRPSLIGA
jgi:hypothetical protein